jgi:hypothetical protein
MGSRFIIADGNWVEFRKLGRYLEVDFHNETRDCPYYEWLEELKVRVITKLREAYENNYEWVIFTHGWSTSRNGKPTARSVVRNVMRSKESTPCIIKSKSIQHFSVFVACIRPKA